MINDSNTTDIVAKPNNILVNEGIYFDIQQGKGYFIRALPTMGNQKYSKVFLYKYNHTKEDVKNTPISIASVFDASFSNISKETKNKKPQKNIQKHFLNDKIWGYEYFVVDFLSREFKELKSYGYTTTIIRGLSIFLEYAEKNNLKMNSVDDLEFDHCHESMHHLIKNDDYENKDTSALVRFIHVVEGLTNTNLISDRPKKRLNKKSKYKNKKYKNAVPSSGVVFQLNYFAKKEIDFLTRELSRLKKSPFDGVTLKSNHNYDFDNISHEKFIELDCFNLHMIYPFVLYFLINYGMNIETIKSWKVAKKKDGLYEPLADDVGLFMAIEGVKKRSNSIITSVITKSSKDWDILLFLTKFLSPLYDKSDTNYLFQFYNCNASKKIMKIEGTFFSNIKQSEFKYRFFKKYDIYDSNGYRVDFIQHRLLRKAHNYQDFLKGKQEFERQLRKAHKSGDTTKIFYENQNLEWADAKKHKIALAQNLLVGIFKGKIIREDDKTAKLFAGAMADCKNNKFPTYDNAPKLKENQVCSDWTKCLTQCEQSCVIPKVHGSVIFAWIDFMEDAKKDFFKEQDWEKEYLIDYQAAKNTIEYFTDSEKEYAKNNSYKHRDFVRMKFPRTYKTGDTQYA